MCLSWNELRTKQVEVRVDIGNNKLLPNAQWHKTEGQQLFPKHRTESKISEFVSPAQEGVSMEQISEFVREIVFHASSGTWTMLEDHSLIKMNHRQETLWIHDTEKGGIVAFHHVDASVGPTRRLQPAIRV